MWTYDSCAELYQNPGGDWQARLLFLRGSEQCTEFAWFKQKPLRTELLAAGSLVVARLNAAPVVPPDDITVDGTRYRKVSSL